MITGYLLANEGVLKPQQNDKLYYYPRRSTTAPSLEKAMKIITTWPLYKKHADLQDKIVKFISISYAPEQIVEMERNDSLNLLVRAGAAEIPDRQVPRAAEPGPRLQ